MRFLKFINTRSSQRFIQFSIFHNTRYKFNSAHSNYFNYCNLLGLPTNFTSPNYIPLDEKLIRSAFRIQAKIHHPDTDTIEGQEPASSYYDIVNARDYLLENCQNPKRNHLSALPKPTATIQHAIVEEPLNRQRPNKIEQKIDNTTFFDNYGFYMLIIILLPGVVYSALKNLPEQDASIPRGDGRHQRRREKWLKRERERRKIKEEERQQQAQLFEYEETEQCSGHLSPLSQQFEETEMLNNTPESLPAKEK